MKSCYKIISRRGTEMTAGQKKDMVRIAVAAMIMIGTGAADFTPVWNIALYAAAYFIVGYDILLKAWEGLKNGNGLDECVLMVIATLGAWGLAFYEDDGYTEAVAVMLFYQTGEWFQRYAVNKSRRNITELMDINAAYANVERADGTLEKVAPDEVEVGTIIVVRAGEKIPVDGVVISGKSSLDTAALTGESMPREVTDGDTVLSGCINLNGVLRLQTAKAFEDSTAARIMELIEEAGARKSRSEQFITRFARVYTPTVVGLAVALAFLPSLFGLITTGDANWHIWIYRALTFLVISCPCALVISVPLSFFAAIGSAGRAGILIKGSNYVEQLAHTGTVVFDKTGTLTKGTFEVVAVHPVAREIPDSLKDEGSLEDRLLHLAAHVESFSTHPIAESLRRAYQAEGDGCAVTGGEEVAGMGIRAIVNGDTVCVGNAAFMEAIGTEAKHCDRDGTIIHVAVNGIYAGHIIISDVLKPHAKDAIRALHAAGVRKLVMLTGDGQEAGDKVGTELGLDEVYGDLLPADKVQRAEELLVETKRHGKSLVFVGDGLNDAPVLARADVGVAMGAMGSDAAIEAADVVLMDDDPLKLVAAMTIAGKCMAIVMENIYMAIGIKVLFLILGAGGIANMWFAIFADVGVMVIAVLNAMRALFAGGKVKAA